MCLEAVKPLDFLKLPHGALYTGGEESAGGGGTKQKRRIPSILILPHKLLTHERVFVFIITAVQVRGVAPTSLLHSMKEVSIHAYIVHIIKPRLHGDSDPDPDPDRLRLHGGKLIPTQTTSPVWIVIQIRIRIRDLVLV